MKTAIGILTLAAFLALSSFAFAARGASDPAIGTWTLNAAKSSGAAVPKSDTRTYAAAEGGLKVTIKRVSADGKESSIQTAYKFDGKDYPISGVQQYDTVNAKRIDSHTVEITQKLAGKVVGTTMRTVAKDGKTLTLVTKSTDATGQPVSTTLVFDRQ
jgi:hypothetical protein